MDSQIPNAIKLHKRSATLELIYADQTSFVLSAEFLRVHSPSAEVRGHGKGQEVLQVGKRGVKLLKAEPVGNYAIKLSFDDGHDTGIYSWPYLYELGSNQKARWDDYLRRLTEAGATRDSLPDGVQVINIKPAPID